MLQEMAGVSPSSGHLEATKFVTATERKAKKGEDSFMTVYDAAEHDWVTVTVTTRKSTLVMAAAQLSSKRRRSNERLRRATA
jgi:hypothetical protein